MSRERRQNVSDPLRNLHEQLPAADLEQGYQEIEEAEVVDVSNLPARLREPVDPPAASPSPVDVVFADIEDARNQPSPVEPVAIEAELPPQAEVPAEEPDEDLALWQQAVEAAEGLELPTNAGSFDNRADEVSPLPPAKKLVIRSRRASLTNVPYLPLLDADDHHHEDAFSHILSEMGSAQPDEHTLISFTFRKNPNYRPEASQWINAVQNGEEVDKTPAALKGLGAFGKFIGFFFKLLTFTIRRILHEARGGEEAPRWNRGEEAPQQPFRLGDDDKEVIKQAKTKLKEHAHFDVALRVAAFSTVNEEETAVAAGSLEVLANNLAQGFSAVGTAKQSLKWQKADDEGIDALLGLMPYDSPGLVLGNAELSNIAHVPDETTWPHGVKIPRSGLKPITPRRMPHRILGNDLTPGNGLMTIGELTGSVEGEDTIGMKVSDLDKHLIAFGKTGTGKSALLVRIVMGIAAANYPLVVNDVHGQLAEDILFALCLHYPERLKDIVLLDIKDDDFPPAINPLDVSNAQEIPGSVSGVLNMLAGNGLFMQSNSPRAVKYARQALTALAWANLKLPNDLGFKLGLLHVPLFFSSSGEGSEFRQLVTELCPVHEVRETFDYDQGRFETLSEAQKVEHTDVVVRVFNSFNEQPTVRRMFSTYNKLDIPALISQRKIVLVKLSRFGGSDELSMMIARMILPAILGSIDQWGRKRDPRTGEYSGIGCRVIADEIGRLFKATQEIPDILAEARKFDLGMIMAGQFADQLETDIRDAVFMNTFSKLSLNQDQKKTAGFETSIGNEATPITTGNLSELNPFEGYGNVLTEGGVSGPFSFRTLPPPEITFGPKLDALVEQVREQSRDLIASSTADADAIYGQGGELLAKTAIPALQEVVRKQSAQAVQDLPDPVFENETDSSDEFTWGA
jgi:hypothetical protein